MSSALPTDLVPGDPTSVVDPKTLPSTPTTTTNTALYFNTAAPTLPAPTYSDGVLPSSSSSSSSPSPALIGAIAGGAALALLLLALVIFLLYRRRRRANRRRNNYGHHRKGHSLGSRSSFGFTIRPGAIPPSLRAPYMHDPVPPSTSSLNPAWGLSMTPTPSATPVPPTPATGTEGDSVLDRLFAQRSPSVGRTDETHGTALTGTSEGRYFTSAEELPALPERPEREMQMREVERPPTASTVTATVAESTRPLVPLQPHPRQHAAKPSISTSENTFYTVDSSGSLLRDNASGVSLAPLGPVLPSFPTPPRIEEASEDERERYSRRLSERLRAKEQRKSRQSAQSGLYALVSQSAASLPGAPHPPTPSSPEQEPQPEMEMEMEMEDVYTGMGAGNSRMSVVPRVVTGDASSSGPHEWIADLDVSRAPATGAVYPDPFSSSRDSFSIRDLEREVRSSQLLPPGRAWENTKEGSVKDDGQSERYRELEQERSINALFEALEPGAKERVRSILPSARLSGAALLMSSLGERGSVAGSSTGPLSSSGMMQSTTSLASTPQPTTTPSLPDSPDAGPSALPQSPARRPKERRSALNVAKAFKGAAPQPAPAPAPAPIQPVTPAAAPAATPTKLRKQPTGRPRR
ncbi:hypothetical protein CALVIDRAFT_567808 [Calocera viscosa TUFC12733]|uniref:Uncharacterized protein n=1 Tax=Calocera viscosa (strain TUFC12733) TaxID=1330018 RepID=A0A167HRZ3_CALVF|nr:hypothetical protein CALVIDRAFT_567808 [Calocera viscosa TUFC12733]